LNLDDGGGFVAQLGTEVKGLQLRPENKIWGHKLGSKKRGVTHRHRNAAVDIIVESMRLRLT
jgi:hypothetical protein